jgi:hypothetical protein
MQTTRNKSMRLAGSMISGACVSGVGDEMACDLPLSSGSDEDAQVAGATGTEVGAGCRLLSGSFHDCVHEGDVGADEPDRLLDRLALAGHHEWPREYFGKEFPDLRSPLSLHSKCILPVSVVGVVLRREC